MQFSDITGAVHDAWTFVWPPFVMIFIVYKCSNLINPLGTSAVIGMYWKRLKDSRQRFKEMHDVLEVYGLSKLLPLISLISVVSLLYLLNGPVNVLASKLPPNISYVPSVLVERSGKEELLLLLRKYPAADSVGRAFSFAHQEIRSKDNYKSQKYDRVNLHYKIQNLIKFSLLCLIFFLMLNLIKGANYLSVLIRSIGGVLIVSLIWVISLVPLLYNQEQSIRDDWRLIQLSLQKEAKTLMKEPVTEEETKKLSGQSFSYSNSWWRIDFIDSRMYKWAKRNILNSE